MNNAKILVGLVGLASVLSAQTVPTFQYKAAHGTYTLMGSDPQHGGSTQIPVIVVPVALSFETSKTSLDASADIPALLRSPVFTAAAFKGQQDTQYADAMLRATFPHARDWHVLLSKPQVVKAVQIKVPAGQGYVLHSKATDTYLAVADLEYVQKQLFKHVPKQSGKLVIAVTHNTTFYGEEDATLCCTSGSHGIDASTGNSFVLASYLSAAPAIEKEQDVQPLTEQLAEFVNDPLHDPLIRQGKGEGRSNQFPQWIRPAGMRPGDQGRCGGKGVASAYFSLEPTDINGKNNLPFSEPFAVPQAGQTFHLQNVALLPWYVGSSDGLGSTYSFPDSGVLPARAETCPAQSPRDEDPFASQTKVKPVSATGSTNGHALIGYWTGSPQNGVNFYLHDVPPEWDYILVAFAAPDHSAPEGTLRFAVPPGIDREQFKREVADLKSRGKKVLISLGGGGEYFSLDHANSISNFVNSVSAIVKEYGFQGIDLDFEAPSLMLAPGDTDLKHPTTPSIVNLISGLRQLRNQFGPSFLITLVPEGPQVAAGHSTYGGQFGSYLPIEYAIRDSLTFMDVQDYNAPPVQGLDGEIYQAGSVDYHAAVTELVLRGFTIGNKSSQMYPPPPQDRIAVGFYTLETTPEIVDQAMRYLVTGERPAGAAYQLQKTNGYPGLLGAMFWTIDADAVEGYRFSNLVGPELHGFPIAK